MVSKRGTSLIFLFAFILLSVGFVASADCGITTLCSPANTVMKISSPTNAHGALYNQGTYTNYLCCDFTGTHDCDSSNTVLRLSSTNNAHAEIPSGTNYNNRVCFGDLTCYTTSSSCEDSEDIPMLSLSSSSNAHLGSFGTYGTKICCTSRAISCGNGIYQPELSEQCDDGNLINGDCCNSICQIETDCTCNIPKTCCYTSDPVGKWYPSGGFISINSKNLELDDVLSMKINSDFCLSGTLQFSIYEDDFLTRDWVTSFPGIIYPDSDETIASFTVDQDFIDDIRNGGESDEDYELYFEVNGEKSEFLTVTLPEVVEPCDLTDASWSTTSATAGNTVQLNVQGTNCNGETIVFTIKENDDFPRSDNNVQDNPDPVEWWFIGDSVTGIWEAEWQDDEVCFFGGFCFEENPPEYYFTAYVEGYPSISIDSGTTYLEVDPQITCPNGVCDEDETCSSCSADCGCEEPLPICEAGVCIAECDFVLNSAVWSTTDAIDGEQVQLIVEGTNCDGESVSFEIKEDDGIMGDDNVQYNPSSITMISGTATGTWSAEWPGYTDGETTPEYYFYARINTLGKEIRSSRLGSEELYVTAGIYCGDGDCNGDEICGDTNIAPECNTDCDECPSECTLISASWSGDNIVDGIVEEDKEVHLDVQTVNCDNGETISFIVKEKDGFLNPDDDVEHNPSNVQVSSNSATGTWSAEWPGYGDGEETPTYYFTATILSNGNDRDSSEPMLTVTEAVDPEQCIGIGSCANYETETSCNADSCDVGDDSVPAGITCGGTYNEETRCYEEVNCGCSWDSSGDGVCEPTWETEVNCGNCGNGVKDVGEECDDGNNEDGDGCSSECEIEDNIDPPCPEGLTLCEDGTCSLNCEVTNDGNKDCVGGAPDGTCEEGVEGCSCEDCDGEPDTCEIGLECSFIDGTCCNDESDGTCNPYCAYIDPDCGGDDAVCGNGLKETGEECDDGNNDDEDGCSSICEIEDNIDPPCPEGLTLCNDGTCSLNCDYTDDGINNTCNNDGYCDTDESCACEDCDGEQDRCASGLECSFVETACCNDISDLICNPYCAYIDPDCVAEEPGDNPFKIGSCSYSEQGEDDCEDGKLVRSLLADWEWDIDNVFSSDPNGEEYVEEPIGTWHYDPIPRKSIKCDDIEDVVVCPAQIEVPFFGMQSLIITIALIVLIYVVIVSRKKK